MPMPQFIAAPAVQNPAFQIPPARVSPQPDDVKFKANEAYFELRICEQFLRYKQEYWIDYNPLTLVLTDFIYGGESKSFPFVVGPALLKGLEQLEGKEPIRYRNTRVAGPAPYRGGDVTIFVGLFRVRMRDWARQALSLLESVAKAFDSSKLSNYLNITEPLMNGIEGFFGMGDQMQFRLGQRDTFTDPELHGGSVFLPRYFVIIRGDQKSIEKDKFSVKDNQLLYGDQLYTEQDYILYQVVHLDKRNDYTTFDFHRQWEKVYQQIWDNNKAKALEGYKHLIALVRRSPDLIPSQMNQLALFYRASFQEELDAYKKDGDPMVPGDPTILIAEIGQAYNKSLELLDRVNPDKQVIDTIAKSLDYFLEKADVRSQIKGPVKLKEKDIQAALSSQTLNDPSIKSVDPDKLTTALSVEAPLLAESMLEEP